MKNSNKVIVLAMLFVSAGNVMFASAKTNKDSANFFNKMAATKQNLDHIHIKNDFGKKIVCQLTWKDRNGAHTTQITDITINPGKTANAAGPMLGYGIEKVEAMASAMAAASAGMVLVMTGYQGSTKAGKNRYFVVIQGDAPLKGASKDTTEHKPTIRGYLTYLLLGSIFITVLVQ